MSLVPVPKGALPQPQRSSVSLLGPESTTELYPAPGRQASPADCSRVPDRATISTDATLVQSGGGGFVGHAPVAELLDAPPGNWRHDTGVPRTSLSGHSCEMRFSTCPCFQTAGTCDSVRARVTASSTRNPSGVLVGARGDRTPRSMHATEPVDDHDRECRINQFS